MSFTGCSDAYLATIRAHISSHIAGPLAVMRKNYGMYDALEPHAGSDTGTDLFSGVPSKQIIHADSTITFADLNDSCESGYREQ
jgi:hypothetical protein